MLCYIISMLINLNKMSLLVINKYFEFNCRNINYYYLIYF